MQSIEYSNSGNVVYHIDTDKRTVTAKIKCSSSEPLDVFNSQLNKHILGTGMTVVDCFDNIYCGYGYASVPAIRMEYIGKAKCHPDDEFDIDYGKMLALLRAKEKYLNAMHKQLDSINEWMWDLFIRTRNIKDKFDEDYFECCDRLYDITRHL